MGRIVPDATVTLSPYRRAWCTVPGVTVSKVPFPTTSYGSPICSCIFGSSGVGGRLAFVPACCFCSCAYQEFHPACCTRPCMRASISYGAVICRVTETSAVAYRSSPESRERRVRPTSVRGANLQTGSIPRPKHPQKQSCRHLPSPQFFTSTNELTLRSMRSAVQQRSHSAAASSEQPPLSKSPLPPLPTGRTWSLAPG